jgi:hypothetical protein
MSTFFHPGSMQDTPTGPTPEGPLLERLARPPLDTPAALFLLGHQPLRFVAGQMLYLLAPMAELLGWRGWRPWAESLSRAHGSWTLESLQRPPSQQDPAKNAKGKGKAP